MLAQNSKVIAGFIIILFKRIDFRIGLRDAKPQVGDVYSTLEALAYYGPLGFTRFTYNAYMNCQLKEILAVLKQKKLVEERKSEDSKGVYAVTPTARTVILHFEKLKELLPIEEGCYQSFQ